MVYRDRGVMAFKDKGVYGLQSQGCKVYKDRVVNGLKRQGCKWFTETEGEMSYLM